MTVLSIGMLCAPVSARAGITNDLQLLRNRCLYYAVGHAPLDVNTVTIRHGLYAQSPFSPEGEIDLAASGFSLAALPAAVQNGLITSNAARAIAEAAALRIHEMVGKSAAATNAAQVTAYGCKGMLYHYSTWSNEAAEFRGNSGVEVSSIDTALLMYGLLASAQYFGGGVLTNYAAARDLIDWAAWLDTATPGHTNQFRMGYRPDSGFFGWWDWRTDETTLLCLFAVMSDPELDARAIWKGWTRDEHTYVSPGPAPESFTCFATWNGDPFTVFYGLSFLDTQRFPRDFEGVDWFEQARTAYRGHVKFFASERGYRDALTMAYYRGYGGVIAEPKSSPNPVTTGEKYSPVYSVAGGLSFYSPNAASNELARVLSLLVTNTPGFFRWTGWPAAAVDAVDPAHPVMWDEIVGQDISLTAVAIENYLTHGIQNLVLRDEDMRRALNQVFPPGEGLAAAGSGDVNIRWQGVPLSRYTLQQTAAIGGGWNDCLETNADVEGHVSVAIPAGCPCGFFRLESDPAAP